ncbi:MAG: 2-C-methyl-D-erythritol 2,4-cyclodiphosphate synthase [Tissierellia bacterium]|nr:2-C-methyl-D-erythritol 2,4-cyclodiphosphate synthase [Tissierellia bacterium]
MRIGIGIDVHQLVENRDLILGGVFIENEKGLLGHSDADVLIHAIMDGIIGALSLGDIGHLFPDTDDAYKDIDSRILLRKVYDLMREKNYIIGNIDANIACQRPKLRPYIDQMRANIAKDLCISMDQISIKATTTEELGFVGRKEGIFSNAICLLKKDQDIENYY